MTYDVVDQGVRVADLAIDVSGARDALGRTQQDYVPQAEFTIDTVNPTVTINQAAGQADPTTAAPIRFAAVFSEAVTGFASADVTLGGTAGATTAVVTGSGAVYDVAVSGMTSAGTVIATIAAGVAFSAAGNTNIASTSSDNTVAYVTAGPSGLVSDDFNSSQLDTRVWTFVNPLGDASYSMSGSQVRLSVPGGQSHDIWTEGIQAPRIMQSAADTDFAVEVKFDSVVSQRYQLQGLLVEQDSGKFLRVDQYSDGSQTRLYVARFTNGAPTVQYNVVIPPSTGSFYLRLAREGDHWMESYSYDGLTWSGAADFTWACPSMRWASMPATPVPILPLPGSSTISMTGATPRSIPR